MDLIRLDELSLKWDFLNDAGELNLGGVKLDEQRVQTLQAAFKCAGPFISVVVDEQQRIIAGHHALEAMRRMGIDQIPVVQIQVDPREERQAMLEVLSFRRCRTKLDECEEIARKEAETPDCFKASYRQGRPRAGEDPPSLEKVGDRAREAGLRERTYARRLRIGRMPQEVRDAVRYHPIADIQGDLEQLAKLPEDLQIAVAHLLRSGVAATVKQAVARVEDDPYRDGITVGDLCITPEDAAASGPA